MLPRFHVSILSSVVTKMKLDIRDVCDTFKNNLLSLIFLNHVPIENIYRLVNAANISQITFWIFFH